MNKTHLASALLFLTVTCALASACGSSGGTNAPATNTGQACTDASQCYTGIDAGSATSEPICLTAVPNGYCTHHCTVDMDCCAVAGWCPHDYAEVCAPFESTTGPMDCFLSCEAADLTKAGFTDATAYCQKFASATFICRSTGGGSTNRKVCVPNG